MLIRKAEEKDIKNICTLHAHAFDEDHFTSTLSNSSLSKFYSTLFKYNNYNFVAYDENNILIGFVVAGNKTKYAIDLFIKDNYHVLLLALLKNPQFLFKKMVSLLKKFINKSKSSNVEMRLLSIAVSKNSKEKGIGTALIEYLEENLRKNEIYSYGLSVKKSNSNAIKFYNKNNFRIEIEEKNGLYYLKNLNAN